MKKWLCLFIVVGTYSLSFAQGKFTRFQCLVVSDIPCDEIVLPNMFMSFNDLMSNLPEEDSRDQNTKNAYNVYMHTVQNFVLKNSAKIPGLKEFNPDDVYLCARDYILHADTFLSETYKNKFNDTDNSNENRALVRMTKKLDENIQGSFLTKRQDLDARMQLILKIDESKKKLPQGELMLRIQFDGEKNTLKLLHDDKRIVQFNDEEMTTIERIAIEQQLYQIVKGAYQLNMRALIKFLYGYQDESIDASKDYNVLISPYLNELNTQCSDDIRDAYGLRTKGYEGKYSPIFVTQLIYQELKTSLFSLEESAITFSTPVQIRE